MQFLMLFSLVFGVLLGMKPNPAKYQTSPLVSSEVSFRISNAEIVANGHFEKIETKILFDPLKIEKTTFSTKIEVESIKTGIRLRDQHLKKPVYFNAALFPDILVELQSIKDLGNGNLLGQFLISMKGISKEQSIPFRWRKEAGQYHFDAEFSINRRDYKVGGKSWTLSDIAKVKVAFVVQDPKGEKS